MARSPSAPVHTFHIPVMGTGFTIDAPLKVARYGIASVVSLVDDVLIEQMRRSLSAEHGEACEPIEDQADDARARRITAYLDFLDTVVGRQVASLREAVFEAGSEIVRYFEMLPASPLRSLYERMVKATGEQRDQLQAQLRQAVVPGAIDVNIMTKLDRDHDRGGRLLPERGSDALSALRGFMQSRLRSSVVLSAGMNRRLFSYMAEFTDLFPDENGELRKRIILKVSDFRSALVQGKMLAKLGLHVSEFRVESGLNCGGHAFGGKGQLLGPILSEFKRERERLGETLQSLRRQALTALGHGDAPAPPPLRITVQGGLGTAEEDLLLRQHYGVDGTGWGSAFLLVPEVVNIDPASLDRLEAAGEKDIVLSGASPLGVPFWSLQTSSSEAARLRRIAQDKPGSRCPKGYLVSNTEFTATPICTASRAYQRRKLEQIAGSEQTARQRQEQTEAVIAKACICHDLAGGATGPRQIDPEARTAVCCGPNMAYFQRRASLREMVDHIYGRARLPLADHRPHMFLKEMSLHVARLREDVRRLASDPGENLARSITECSENLLSGVQHYRELAQNLVADQREVFLDRLETLRQEIAALTPVPAPVNRG
jgi:hypothetical protein